MIGPVVRPDTTDDDDEDHERRPAQHAERDPELVNVVFSRITAPVQPVQHARRSPR